MFDKIKNIVKSFGKKSNLPSSWNLFNSNSGFSNFDRDNYAAILSKLGGYQYYAGEYIARTVASQKIRLYETVPTNISKHTGKTQQIFMKNIPVPKQRLEYFKGNGITSHNDIMYKALGAEKGIVEILDHPKLSVLKDINPYSNQWEFFFVLTLAMQFYGNSFFNMLRDSGGNVFEIWFVPNSYMKIVQGKTTDNFISHYIWGEAIGEKQTYAPEDILDFKIPGVGVSQVYGVSRIEIAWKYINLMDSSLAFKQALNKNMNRPDFIVSTDSKALAALNSDDLTRLERQWLDENFGETQAGKMVFAPGNVKVDVLPRSDIDYDGDKPLIKAISAAFGLPEDKLGTTSNIAANSSQMDYDYKKYTIDSYLTLIEEVLNENFLSEEEIASGLFFAFDPILEEDREVVEKRIINKANNGLITANNAALQLGEPEEDGGDVLRFRGRSYESLDKQGSTNTTPTPNEDKEILIPAEKNIDIKDDEMSELLKQIDDVIDDIDKEKEPDSPQFLFNFGSEVVVEEKTVVEDSEKREVVENVEVIDTGIDYKVNDEELEYFSKKGIDKEIENIEVIEESLSDKLAKRIKE